MNTSQANTPEDNEKLISPRQLLLQEIATMLVEARTAKQQPISKPVRKLKIPANHLQALESGKWDSLPDDVYVIGFLRQYSKYLGIDLSEQIDRLKNPDYTLTRPLTFPDPPVAPSRLWAWLTGGAFVVLFILFNVLNNDDNQDVHVQADNTPAAPGTAQTINNSDDTANAITPSTVNTTGSDAKSNDPATHNVADTATTLASKQIAEALKNAAVENTAVKPASKTNKPASASVNAKLKTLPALQQIQPKQQAKTKLHEFRFEAVTAPVWMQIFLPNAAGDGKGRLLKEILLKKGRVSTIRYATETLWITCGNALALRIYVDRKTVVHTGKLGAGKKVLRDYRFDISTQ
ncbi:XRE family transcriptional regulator [Mariprofundus sp. EBB-1]|uniref:helix-turn-helix domain-containing protein n=1 Tax=Mariprofundus sp. EBB-1 TaxID=2650971 RepID=UPI000EF1BF4C|nr:helix-turn-helix domain-containing protein [Mariprofundus sp. EBB-1]RLL53666.1 XRE family transcriptional regulator [Mariprofundus sp. EBB-1]